MFIATENQPVVDEEIWRALDGWKAVWLQERKLRDEAIARKAKVLGAIAAVLLALGSAFYLFAMR
jgi:hypothetical protein